MMKLQIAIPCKKLEMSNEPESVQILHSNEK